eukprot:m51a1_g781 hypothetical protein (223) ;mRNA; r:617832-618556
MGVVQKAFSQLVRLSGVACSVASLVWLYRLGTPLSGLVVFWTNWGVTSHALIGLLCALPLRSPRASRLRELLLCCSFAHNTTVALSFWALWLMNPAFLFRSGAASNGALLDVYPQVLAHMQHTLPFVFLLAELALFGRNCSARPAAGKIAVSTVIVGLVYLGFVGCLFLTTPQGTWPYPFLDMLSPLHWAALLAFEIGLIVLAAAVSSKLSGMHSLSRKKTA